MLLYLTTSRPSLQDEKGNFLPCPHSRICRLAGKNYPHLCWTTEPLAGAGKYVFSVDLPQAEVTKYEYKNEFKEEWLRFFAVPTTLLVNAKLERSTYEEMTGVPWNVWELTVLDKRQLSSDVTLQSKWACIWLSRESVATARVVENSDDHMVVEIVLTDMFDPDTDYVVLENHSEFVQKGFAKVKETWHLSTVAGTTPQWAIYPTAWRNWAWNPEITQSAIDYIVTHVPGVRSEVAFAKSRTSKHNRVQAWRDVAVKVGQQLSIQGDEEVDLGLLKSHSWTAVQAMPHRIAQRIGEHLPYSPWEPPRPKPEYIDPERSGRYLLANMFGPYPTQGPGIDHPPQMRPFMSREDKQGGGFNVGQRYAARSLT